MIDLEKDIWKPVLGYEGIYEVSQLGTIKRIKKGSGTRPGKILKSNPDKDGYLMVNLYRKGTKTWTAVHRIVGHAFCQNPNKLPQVNHKNGNKTDNHFTNLEWVTSAENTKHAIKTGLRNNKGKNNHNAKLNPKLVREILSKYRTGKYSQMKLASEYNIGQTTVSKIVLGKHWASN